MRAIAVCSMDRYNQPAKALQTKAVMNLARGRTTFLLAGTGFGKSRVAELYYDLLPKKDKAVVLVLNPLESLGDNQVLEKQRAGYSAINLTKLTFNPHEAKNIANGKYNFVYLSPEIYLNSQSFQLVF